MRKKETTLRRELGVVLVETFNILYGKSQYFFRQFDLTPQQYNVLAILHAADSPLSTSEILKRMVEKKADVSRLVDRLLAKELVRKKVKASDNRLIDVSLTGNGLKLLQVVSGRLEELDMLYNALSDQEALDLTRLLQKLGE